MKPSILRTFLCCICTLFFGLALTTTQSFADQSVGSAECSYDYQTITNACSAAIAAAQGNSATCKTVTDVQSAGLGYGNERCDSYCYSPYTSTLYGATINAYTIFCNKCKSPWHLVYGGVGCYITSNVNDYCITNTTTTSGCYNTTTYKGGSYAGRTVEWGKQTDSSSSGKYNGTVDQMCRDAINNTYSCASTCYKTGSTVTSNSGCSACPISATGCDGTTFTCASDKLKVINRPEDFPDSCRNCPLYGTCDGTTTLQCNNPNFPFVNGIVCSACPEHATCSGTTVSCNQGYYLDDDECTQCPEYKGVHGTTVTSGKTGVGSCYMPSGSHTSSTGTFTLAQQCDWCTTTCLTSTQCSGTTPYCLNGCCSKRPQITSCIVGRSCDDDSDCGTGSCLHDACVCPSLITECLPGATCDTVVDCGGMANGSCVDGQCMCVDASICITGAPCLSTANCNGYVCNSTTHKCNCSLVAP